MKTTTIILILIMLLGFVLRVAGINFGLPDIYHADEPIVVNHAMAYGSGDFNPHFFNIPPFISYLLFFFYAFSYVAGKIAGLFGSPEDFAIFFLRDPTYFYILGRVICGVFFGTASIFVVYKLAKKLFSEQVGLLSALFFSVCFLHVQQSHYIYVDVPMVFLILCSCLFILSIMDYAGPKNYFTAACLIGLIAATKYNGILAFAAIPVALWAAKDEKVIPKTLTSLIAVLIVFVIFNPFSLFDFGSFSRDVLEQSNKGDRSRIFNLWSIGHHLSYSLKHGLGYASVMLGVFGAVYFLFKDWKKHLVFLVFPFLFYLSLGKISQSFERYALSIVPFLIIYASAFIFQKMRNKLLFLLAVLVVLIPNLEKALYSDFLFMNKDTRTLAREWAERNIPPGSKIAIGHSFFCPHLRQSAAQVREKFAFLSKEGESVRSKRLSLQLKAIRADSITYNLYYLKEAVNEDSKFLFEKPRLPFSTFELKRNGIQYVILHIDSKKNFKAEFHEELAKNAVLLQEFTPYLDKEKKFAKEEVSDANEPDGRRAIVQTAAPFFTGELLGRVRNGYIIKIYRLNI